jgi:SAM-dependent methyltransferase
MDDPTLRTRDTYDAIAARYLENARNRADVLPAIDAFVREAAAGATVIDLGAGPGMDTALLAERGLRAIGLDFSIGMLRAGAGDFPGSRIQGDARRLPLATGCVDAIWANASLLHLADDDALRALQEVRRVLRPGGVLYLAVKAGSGAATETARYGLPRFFQYWSAAKLDAALAAQGFRVLRATAEAGPRDVWLTRLARRA